MLVNPEVEARQLGSEYLHVNPSFDYAQDEKFRFV